MFWILTLTGLVIVDSVTKAQNTDSTPLIIRHADRMIGSETESGATRQLDGNVQMLHGDVEIRCDRAQQELTTGRAELIGNVIIVQGTLKMTMQRGVYLSAERRAYGVGNVVIRDGAATLAAPQGEYFLDRRLAVFHRGVHFLDSNTTILADSMIYERTSGRRWAWRNVELFFLRQATTVRGDSAFDDPVTNTAIVMGRTLLMQSDSAATDTLYMRADSLRLRSDSARVRYLIAHGSVRLVRGAIRVCANHAELHGNDILVFSGNPIVWADSAQLSGETIRAELVDGRLRTVHAVGNAMLGIIEDSTCVVPHQLMADRIKLEFNSDSLRTVRGGGSVYTLYQHRTDDNRPDGITRVASDSIVIAFTGGQISRCTWLGKVHSEYVPEHRLDNAERYLRGFRWSSETKPTRDELLHASAEQKTH
ncbi:MAG: hypothetical protein N2663_08705 [Chlorobi bacterium]|nr:hypothetical protein [Chlorobiota bacterium]